MLNLRYGTAILALLLVAALPDRALSQILPDETSDTITPPTRSMRVDEPICYMKTASGQMINLRSICEERSNATNRNNPRVQAVGNLRGNSSQFPGGSRGTVRSGGGFGDEPPMNDR